MADIEQQILSLTEAELDDFPLGIIRLDRAGKILHYNRREAKEARLTAASTIGLNFFRDVAPCTAVRDFEGRFNAFVEAPGSRIEPFSFVFRFSWGTRRVNITMVRRSQPEESIYIVINAPHP